MGEVSVPACSSWGDSGENEGKDVKDLSEGAIEEAELPAWEVWDGRRFLLLFVRKVVERWELRERTESWEMERSSSSGEVDVKASESIVGCVVSMFESLAQPARGHCCVGYVGAWPALGCDKQGLR